MRISTNQIYDSGKTNILRNQASLYKLQNQLSTGRRVLSPEDDPVAAAQALVVTQSRDVNLQHIDNQKTASSQLGLVDTQLDSLVKVLQNVRDRMVQAGNSGAMTYTDREAIATELEARLDEMVGISNSQNGAGDYLFSGYQGSTLPFAIDAATGSYAYYGDDGLRLLQVSSSRQLPINATGSDVFMNARSGNGTFEARTGGNVSGGINQGTALIDAGSVLDLQSWQTAINGGFAWADPTNPAIQIEFSVVAEETMVQLFDASVPGAPVAITDVTPYVSGQAITLASTTPTAATDTSFGGQVIVKGEPVEGDTFLISPSTNQSLFQTLQDTITLLRTPIGSANNTSTQYTNDLGAGLTNLDSALANVNRVQAAVGTRMREVDSLGDTASDLDLQYKTTLSGLQDLDYVEALSDFSLQQVYLEAAQKSFTQINGLSLFNYL